MQALSQSAFLQALGYAIANSLWQAALLWLLAAVCNGLIKLPAQVKYKVALAAQFGAFIWFVITLQFYYVKCSEAINQLGYNGVTNANALVLRPGMHSFSSVLLTVILKAEMLLPYLSVAYMCLLTFLAVRWVRGYRETQLIKTSGLQKIDIEWRLFIKKVADHIGIKKQVRIYVSALVKGPLTLGFLKPVILVPLASINSLTTYQLEAVLLHELAHIKRADYLINIIQTIIETALFFNPFTQLLSKMIRRERENSCDDWVLQFQYDASAYAEALLRIAYLQHAPALAMNAAAGKENDLLWRVKRMLNQQQKTFQYRNRLVALLMITGILTSVAWFHPQVKKETTVKPVTASKQPVVVEPMSAKIDNPWFNPVSFLNKPLQAEVDKAVKDAKAALQVSTELTLDKTGEVLENVFANTGDNDQTANVNLPQILNAAGNAANNALKNVNLSTGESTIDMKGMKDSLNLGSIINLAINKGLKSVDWKGVGDELKTSQAELKKVLNDKALNENVSGAKIKEAVLNSLNSVKSTIFRVNSTSADDEEDSPGVSLQAGSGSKATKSKREIKLQMKAKATQVNRSVDSLVKVYSRVNTGAASITASGVGIDANTDDDENVVAVANTPAVNGYGITNFIPVKYNQGLPYNVSVGAGNMVTVKSIGSSTLIAVKEDADNTSSYKKRITIQTLDSTGQRHTFHVTVEMFQ
jgi:bla regulator protein BlaR1